jgi:NRAMP (natural resistance-associated macrophage protein)-like metal ion transporter
MRAKSRTSKSLRAQATRLWRVLGPGLITGAADDDPSGIATYSQAGAQFGYALTWTMLLTVPFMAAIQIISARLGWQTQGGLTKSIGQRFPKPVLYVLVALLVGANTLNIAADLSAMGAALRLVVHGPAALYTIAFGLGCLMAEVFVPYHRYAGYLKFLTLVLLVYVVAALSLDVPWPAVAWSTLVPAVSLHRGQLLTVLAVFGTTISPYLFFWQASQEAEESMLSHRRKHRRIGGAHLGPDLRHISIDTWCGMSFSNLIGFCIIVTTAATLHAHGLGNIQTAAQAAEALRPLAGPLTFLLFAAGIIGTGLLAVPVLAGSAAYAVAEAFGIRASLESTASRAIGFYGVVSAATVAGAGLAMTHVDPIAMLFWTAVINGIVAVPIMLAMMVLVSGRSSQDTLWMPLGLRVLGWLAVAVMAVAAASYLGSALMS